jgi:hypothetical protein
MNICTYCNFVLSTVPVGAYSSIVGSWLGHYAKIWKVMGSIPIKDTGFFNWSNPSTQTMILGSMSMRILPGGKGGPAHKANSLNANYESIV